MAGLKHEALRLLCSLLIVMALGAFLAIPVTAVRQDFLGEDPDMIDSMPNGPPLQGLEVEMRAKSGDGDDEVQRSGDDDDDGGTNYTGEGVGIVEGDGGCPQIPGDHTTAGEGHLLASGLVLCLPIYLLANQLLL